MNRHDYQTDDDVFVPEVRKGYSPHIKQADLSTIQEAYQYLMKKFVIIPREKRRRLHKMRHCADFVTPKNSNSNGDEEFHPDEEKDPEMMESARILAELQKEEKMQGNSSQLEKHELEEMNHFSEQLNDLIAKEFADLNLENHFNVPAPTNLNSPVLSRTNSGKRSKRGSKKHLDHLGTPTNGSRRGSRHGSKRSSITEELLDLPKNLVENRRTSLNEVDLKSVLKRGFEDQHLDLPNLSASNLRRQSVDVAMLGSGARRKSDTPYPARRGSSFKLKQ